MDPLVKIASTDRGMGSLNAASPALPVGTVSLSKILEPMLNQELRLIDQTLQQSSALLSQTGLKGIGASNQLSQAFERVDTFGIKLVALIDGTGTLVPVQENQRLSAYTPSFPSATQAHAFTVEAGPTIASSQSEFSADGSHLTIPSTAMADLSVSNGQGGDLIQSNNGPTASAADPHATGAAASTQPAGHPLSEGSGHSSSEGSGHSSSAGNIIDGFAAADATMMGLAKAAVGLGAVEALGAVARAALGPV